MKFFFTVIGFAIGAAAGGFGVGLLAGGIGFGLAYWMQKDEASAPGRDSGQAAPRPLDDLEPEDMTALRRQMRSLRERVDRLEAQLGIAPPPPMPVQPPAPAEAAAPLPLPEVVAPVAEPAQVVSEVSVEPPAPSAPEPAVMPEPLVSAAPQIPEPAPSREEAIRAPEPAGPSLLSRLISGNIVAKVGVVVLFLGVGFLLKFAYDRGMMPPQLRLAAVAALAVALFFIGWRLRESRRLYAMILQGGASGLAYLDVFFALKTYGYIGPVPAFGLFALLGVATTMAAVRQDAVVLAVLGLIGAFSAPVLASTGGGNHVLLFSYYALLNVFILAVSWFKAWRPLNLTGWFFTFAVGLAWGANNYRPELFATVEPFVLLFFALYLVIPILFATRQPPALKGVVDATLVFGTPAAVAVMQAGLVRDLPYGLAWSAAVGAALYALLAALVWRHANMRMLRETYVALAVGLGTLAIFFGFDAYPTFALWTLEGTAILWVGLRQQHALARWAGLAVQAAGAVMFLLEYPGLSRPHPLLNDAVYGCLWITVAGTLSAFLLRRYAERVPEWQRGIGTLLLVWGALWWSAGGLDVFYHAVPRALLPASAGIFFAATFVLAEFAGRRLRWDQLRGLGAAHAAVIAIAALAQLERGGHALGNLGWLAWPLGFAGAFWSLWRQQLDGVALLAGLRYAVLWSVLALLATWEGLWLLREGEYAYGMLLAAFGHAAAWLRYRLREQEQPSAARLSVLVLLWAMAFWFAHGGTWAHERFDFAQFVSAGLGLVAASAVLYEVAGRWLGWAGLRHCALVLCAAMPAAVLAQFGVQARPWEAYGWAAWPVSFVAGYWTLARQRSDGIAWLVELRFAVLWGVFAVLATWEQMRLLQERAFGYGMLLAAAGYAIAYLRFRWSERDRDAAVQVSGAVLLWSMAFWFVHGGLWAADRFEHAASLSAVLGLAAASALAYEAAGRLLGWVAMRHAALVLWVAMLFAALLQFEARLAPFASYGWIAWPAALGVAYWSLHRQEADAAAFAAPLRHALGLWLATVLAGRELADRFAGWGFGTAWRTAAWGLSLAIALGATVVLGNRGRWPAAPHRALYRGPLLAPIVLLGLAWTLYANLGVPGGMAPLPYLPVANPLDLAVGVLLTTVLLWSRWYTSEEAATGILVQRTVGALGFVWVNAIALRSIHFWADVPYRIDRLLASVLVQATLSLLWTGTAMALMLAARRNGRRPLWVLGAALLAVVVGKLFLVDLANTGTVARIVSFLGVGALLLVIGYVAPVPPGEAAEGKAPGGAP